MKEFIEKLIGRLEVEKEEAEYQYHKFLDDSDNGRVDAYEIAIEIVNELAEEYAKDQNWKTTRNYLDEKYFSKIRELSSKYNHPCENLPINFDWFFGLIEKIEKAEAVEDSGWIPCSERFPNKEEYLKDDGRFIVTDGNRSYEGTFDIYSGKFQRDCFAAVIEDDKCVIAWQPLPEKYKGE